jgi:peptidoglycan hydrolase CwlO-like protein
MRILPNKSKFVALFKLFSIIILSFSLISINIPQVAEGLSLEEELNQVKKELEEIRNTKKNLEQDISNEKSLQNTYEQELVNLKNKIDLLSNKIDEKRLVIKELELEIDILTKKLEETEKEIEISETELLGLEDETNTRLVDMYLSQKTFSELNMIVTPKGQSDVIKYNLYHNTIQDTTNSLVADLKEKRVNLEDKKVGLEEDKIKVLRDEVQLNEELLALERDEADLNSTRSIYSSKRQQSIAKVATNSRTLSELSEEEQKTLAMQYKIEQELFNTTKNLGNGSYVKQGTIIGRQGYTGYVIPSGPAGAHLHFGTKVNGSSVNPCSLLIPGVISGCGGDGSMEWPLKNPFNYTSAYGWRWERWHDAIDISSTANVHAYIYAAHDGWLYKGGSASQGFWRKICETKDNCNQGKYSFYLHLAE